MADNLKGQSIEGEDSPPWRVYRITTDDQPVGDELGIFATQDEAMAFPCNRADWHYGLFHRRKFVARLSSHRR